MSKAETSIDCHPLFMKFAEFSLTLFLGLVCRKKSLWKCQKLSSHPWCDPFLSCRASRQRRKHKNCSFDSDSFINFTSSEWKKNIAKTASKGTENSNQSQKSATSGSRSSLSARAKTCAKAAFSFFLLSHRQRLHAASLSWNDFSFQFIVRRNRHLSFYSCDKRDSIGLRVKVSWIFFAHLLRNRFFHCHCSGWQKLPCWEAFSASLLSLVFLLSYERMNYTWVLGMLRIILPFLLSCNNELLFCLNTAYGKDFMAILAIWEESGNEKLFMSFKCFNSQIWRARQTVLRRQCEEYHGADWRNRHAQMHGEEPGK